MAGDFFAYSWALLGYAKWLLTGGPFLVDTLVKKYRPDWTAWLDQWISPENRRRIEIGFLILAVFFASFLAWRDEHNLRLAAQGHHIVGRRLTEDDKASLRKNFDGHKKDFPLIIVSSVDTIEAERYAYDFTSFLTDRGFIVASNPNAVPLEESDTGLMVGVIDPDKPSESAKLFTKLLLDSGLRIKQVKFGEGKPPIPMPVDFDLFIGERGDEG
jgi:hypothetical protein